QCARRCCRPSLTSERLLGSAGSLRGGLRTGRRTVSPRISASRALAGLLRRLPLLRRLQVNAGPPCLRQSDRNGLLRGSRAMLPLTNVLHLLAHEFPCLSARGFPLAAISACPLNGLLLWHRRLQ